MSTGNKNYAYLQHRQNWYIGIEVEFLLQSDNKQLENKQQIMPNNVETRIHVYGCSCNIVFPSCMSRCPAS